MVTNICCNECDESENNTTLYTCIYCNDDDFCLCIECLEEHITEHSYEIIQQLIKDKKFNTI